MGGNRSDPAAPAGLAAAFVDQLPACDTAHRVMLGRIRQDEYAFADHGLFSRRAVGPRLRFWRPFAIRVPHLLPDDRVERQHMRPAQIEIQVRRRTWIREAYRTSLLGQLT